jgi:glycosyltransferase involved in cell wall biosynthesis
MTKRLRMLFLSHARNDPDGGASRIYHMLVDGLLSRGHEVEVHHLEDLGLPKGRRAALVAQRFAMPHYISRLAEARTRERTFDVVMSSSGMAAPFFRAARKATDRPVLVNHLHGLYVYDHLANISEGVIGNWPTSLPYRLVTGPRQVSWDNAGIAYADVTIVQNMRDLGWVSERLPDRANCEFIPAALHPRLLDTSSLPQTERRRGGLVWFASWESRKGSYYVSRALRLIREVVPYATLTIGGTGKSAAELIAQFDERDRGAIKVLGHISIDEQVELFRGGEVFLFPSLSEGFGLALVEAMACGLAAVTTATAFGGDWLTNGRDARVVFPSSNHIASAAIDLLQNVDMRDEIARRGAIVAREFTLDRMVNGYEDLFLRATASRRRD